MKKITINGVNYGAYNTIEVLDDRYRCDGADLPFSVVGQGVISDVIDGDFTDITTQMELDLIPNAINTVKETTSLSVPVVVNGVTYNGGESSASAIMGGINLANLKMESSIQIWDINDNVATCSIPDAMTIVAAIAVDYRARVLARQAKIMAISQIVINPVGTYPDYASAKAAIDLIIQGV